ncbi:MAG: polyprenyl synthetase family protein [Alphaproteobacteria bacterium]|nr:polyprenyl synthetase family protein [Alphaproteobacteria bacterium]MBU0797831.1 polyprenyl synthetase family protein [Alphaproteobacteria bacterium]MBU0886091.1 polyprenyl synthetase family protein [Alphaproteobacteria bacterium]MBU1814577.1 polyprenyl synthetase family protein [Alphaproteobacteria bacterium]MBU2089253.1 polyprenyl synthetase family protein [Alphaproteobacteria bacterium]
MNIKAAMAEAAEAVEHVMDRLLPIPEGPEARVIEAMRYSSLGGGKRFRAFLVLESAKLFAVSSQCALRVAAAVEFLHAYSLIHDDLPAMDDSDLRRGRPSCHKQFDEATAVLAGDGLLTYAFEVLAHENTHADPKVRADLVLALAKASGTQGMVGGQMIDLLAETTPDMDAAQITRLQRMKTAALICFSCEAGAILGKAGPAARHALQFYGQEMGLAFQIGDDLLDVEGDSAETGKPTGLDQAAGKATLVAVQGAESARAHADMLVEQAGSHLDFFDGKATLLKEVARFVINRRS